MGGTGAAHPAACRDWPNRREMNEWIRIDVGMPDDPKVHAIAQALAVEIPTAIGLLSSVFCRMAQHATNGDLDKVSDFTLEHWAVWRGQPGKFAAEFQARFMEGHQVKGWLDRQGKLLEIAEKQRQRMENRRALENYRSTVIEQLDNCSFTVVAPLAQTGRDMTGQDKKTKAFERKSGAALRDDKKGRYPARAVEIWAQHTDGTISPGEAGRILKPLVAIHGEELVLRILDEVYFERQDSTFWSLRNFASNYGKYSGKVKAGTVAGSVEDEIASSNRRAREANLDD
jgi:hypothetical protein